VLIKGLIYTLKLGQMTSKTIKLAIADDHDLFREGIQSIVNKMAGISLVLEVSNGLELLHGLKNQSVDVILMNLQMHDMDGIEASEKIIDKFPEIKILVLTMHNEERMITHMMESGVNGYLLKNTKKDELEKAIKTVHNKGFYFNDQVSHALLSGLKRKNKSRPSFTLPESLTSREHEVLELICKEHTTMEIAEQLFISHRTVEGHRKKLMDKFNVKNTIGLVIKAYKENMINY